MGTKPSTKEFTLKKNMKLEAKDVLPNINRTQATERDEKCRFFVPGDHDL